MCPVCREPHYGGPGELLQVYFETAAEPEEEGRVKVEGEGGPCAHTGAAAEVERLRGELMLAQAARAAALRREEQARQSQEAFRADTLQEAERLRERGTAEAVELRHQLDLANSALEKEKRDVQAKEAEVLSLKRLYAAFSSNKELDVSVWRASMQGYSEKAANEVLLNAVAKRDKDYRQLTRKFGEIQGKMEAAVARGLSYAAPGALPMAFGPLAGPGDRAGGTFVTEKDFLDSIEKVIKGYQKFSSTPKYMVRVGRTAN